MTIGPEEDILTYLLKERTRVSAIDFFAAYDEIDGAKQNLSIVDPENWYKTFPFEVVVVKLGEAGNSLEDIDERIEKEYVYALPMPPSAISVTMQAASQATPTLGGVVEETSKNTFWTISMNGTMGISPNRANEISGVIDTTSPAKNFREVKKNLGLISGTLDKFATLGQFAVDTVSDFKNGENVEAMNKLFTTTPIFSDSAVSKDSNGFYEMMLFHRFLFAYSAMKEQQPNKWALYFRHHKDSVEWRVTLQDFRFVKTSQSPYKHQYTLIFKGWDMTPLLYTEKTQDRFAEGGDLNGLKTFTITGAFTKIANLTQVVASGPGAIVDSISGGGPIV